MPSISASVGNDHDAALKRLVVSSQRPRSSSTAGRALEMMRKDKKARGGVVRYVLPLAIFVLGFANAALFEEAPAA